MKIIWLITIFIIIFILILIFRRLFFKRKLQQFSQQIRQKINYINLLMHKIHESIGIRYPSIYYELQKIDNFVLSNKFKLCSMKRIQTILKHLEDIENILIQVHFQNNKNDQIEFSIPYMMLLTYNQIIEVLLDKYGEVPGNYFLDQQCTKVNEYIKRSSEGLQIHHIKENEMKGLSNPEFARKAPFSYQMEYNLVYCNLLEHFLLHCKIWDHSANPLQVDVGQNGAQILLNELEQIHFANTWRYQNYKRKAAQTIFFQKKSFFQCRRFFIVLQIIKS
ncbi:MAG: hypothetical protein Q8875_00745 [Pigeon pea little leaf phytoplasma]|nr:hypothetical protein [Candidatus Phytoplasma stylosanthis]MDV3138690.1 hypothetical protein [Candidatus Phytoplasma australasiaticum]MDV3195655.1 hypothetical protein [Pigeon pea little leaf phytoplasma]MDV3168115.1 hypothetical protein [Candidatus Phytoplasma stylosanthis]MDV3173679.1 hypothetical protein [Candidatus Phytoplasma stylosanthis]MDV3174216.1 hypothetical protein [Candidatus Phytoplasma stylosanthis]